MNKVFIVMFEKPPLFSSYNPTKFHQTLTTANGIVNWFHYITTSYILICSPFTSIEKLTSFIKKQLPKNTYFIVLEVNVASYNGQLPKEAWDWVKENVDPNSFVFRY